MGAATSGSGHGAYARVAAWLAFAMLMLASAFARADPPLVLTREADVANVREHLRYFRDESGAATLADVRAADARGAFAPVTAWPPTFGFAPGAHWFRLSVENGDHPAASWLLAVRYALLDHADLHVVYPDGRILVLDGGDRVPFAARAVAHRHPNYLVNLGRGSSATLYLRVASQSSVQVPIALSTQRAFMHDAPAEHLALGLYFGVILGLFCYNLILFFATRDLTFFYYVLYAGSFGLLQLCLSGLAFQYLWPESPEWANQAVLVTIAIALMTMLAFTRTFLNLRTRWRLADRAMLALTYLFAGTLVAIPWLGYRITIEVETALVFVVVAVIVTAAVKVLRDGYRPALNYLVAWGLLVLGILAYASVSFGLLPKMFLTEYGILVGSAAEMILLSFALADRINTLRDENARLQREARDQLEARVAARTAELGEAMSKLQSVNRMLQEFSLRDGLTGTHNRRYFDQSLTEQWARAKETGSPMSLVMVDIDHFKRINDEHGHLAGDDCLRAVGQALTASLRDPDERVVRYGGEEFFMILPGTEPAAARTRAEAIRQRVAELVVKCEGAAIPLTVSVGVATFRPDAPLDHNDLLRITDRALYDAKRAGRNRVVVTEA